MAMMSHECSNPKCNWARFDNKPGPRTCPKCGEDVITLADEDPADHDDDRDYEREDGEDDDDE